VWELAIGLSVTGSVASFGRTYPTAAERQQRAEVIDTPIARLFVGPGSGRLGLAALRRREIGSA
jgi:ABC-2 type transport system permease protein